jgi:hypothetical protein
MKNRKRVRRLTPNLLRRIVQEERSRIIRENDPIVQGIDDPEKVDAEEVDADEYADTLEKDLDHLKALKIQESRLRRRLKKVGTAKRILVKKLSK